jgi:hypothetical protein
VSRCARGGSTLPSNPRDAYLAFAAFSACATVLGFFENPSSPDARDPAPGAFVATVTRSEHFLHVDPAAARALELVAPLDELGEPSREPAPPPIVPLAPLAAPPPIVPLAPLAAPGTPRPSGGGRKSRSAFAAAAAAAAVGRRSLFGALNTCATKGGRRLLKLSLLRPPRDLATIEARLDAVQALVANPAVAERIRAELAGTGPADERSHAAALDADEIFSKLDCSRRRRSTATVGSTRGTTSRSSTRASEASLVGSKIRVLLDARALFASAAKIGDILLAEDRLGARSEGSPLFAHVVRSLRSPFVRSFPALVASSFEPEVVRGRHAFAAATRVAFAVRSGRDAFLDLARRRFAETAEAAREQLEIVRGSGGGRSNKARMTYAEGSGFALELDRRDFEEARAERIRDGRRRPRTDDPDPERAALVRDATDVRRLDDPSGARAWDPPSARKRCTSPALDRVNARHLAALEEALTRSRAAVDDLARAFRDEHASVAAACSSLALLDLLCAFARRATRGNAEGLPYVRPRFTTDAGDDAPLVVENGRHPLLEERHREPLSGGVGPPARFVPNATYLSRARPLVVVEGANGAGKSTYLRQVATILVMAHAGCFVPATHFSCPGPLDAIVARCGTSDDAVRGASSFAAEMRETRNALERATENSFAFFDELGRSATSADGERVAWAVAEALAARGCMTLFATHHDRLGPGLARAYPGRVVVANMAAGLGEDEAFVSAGEEDDERRERRRAGIRFEYRLAEGPCAVPNYGLRVAERSGLPRKMLDYAWAVARTIDARKEVSTRGEDDGANENGGAEGGAGTAAVAAAARRACESVAEEGLGGRALREALAALRVRARALVRARS